ncbi:hypothetical protein ACI7RC_18760 [Brevibacillus sp. B_LB10_24]|uniref:spermine/spermidine synthase domain-containing protein n=1 Tax=Brevibacillus sp. B_LB10_24 TaxID=3380645 RepID=UPI0038BAE78D
MTVSANTAKFIEGSPSDSPVFAYPKVRTVVADGRSFVEQTEGNWDVIILDLPEPSSNYPELGRLFSMEFYRLLKERLETGGAIGVACSIFSTSLEYVWSIQATLKAAGYHVLQNGTQVHLRSDVYPWSPINSSPCFSKSFYCLLI